MSVSTCATCKHVKEGHCRKILEGVAVIGVPVVRTDFCCKFYEVMEFKNCDFGLREADSLVLVPADRIQAAAMRFGLKRTVVLDIAATILGVRAARES